MQPSPSDDGTPRTAMQVDDGPVLADPDNEVSHTLDEEGDHLVRYWARDLAGNENDGGPMDNEPGTARVRVDLTPPALAFADRQDPADPEVVHAGRRRCALRARPGSDLLPPPGRNHMAAPGHVTGTGRIRSQAPLGGAARRYVRDARRGGGPCGQRERDHEAPGRRGDAPRAAAQDGDGPSRGAGVRRGSADRRVRPPGKGRGAPAGPGRRADRGRADRGGRALRRRVDRRRAHTDRRDRCRREVRGAAPARDLTRDRGGLHRVAQVHGGGSRSSRAGRERQRPLQDVKTESAGRQALPLCREGEAPRCTPAGGRQARRAAGPPSRGLGHGPAGVPDEARRPLAIPVPVRGLLRRTDEVPVPAEGGRRVGVAVPLDGYEVSTT